VVNSSKGRMSGSHYRYTTALRHPTLLTPTTLHLPHFANPLPQQTLQQAEQDAAVAADGIAALEGRLAAKAFLPPH
jgi:hypothetical protein